MTKKFAADIFETTRCLASNGTGYFHHRIRQNPDTKTRICTRCDLTDVSILQPPPAIPITNTPMTGGKRKRIVERDIFRGCRYCGFTYSSLASLTLEHLDSKHAQGDNSIDNLGLSCAACNGLKGPMTEEEFVAWLFDRTMPERIPVEAQVGLHRNEMKRRTMAAAFQELLNYLREEGLPLHAQLYSP